LLKKFIFSQIDPQNQFKSGFSLETASNFNIFFLQASAYASEDGILTEQMVDARVMDVMEQHSKKVTWQKEDALRPGRQVDTYVSPKQAASLHTNLKPST
jgi:hypothetical protein